MDAILKIFKCTSVEKDKLIPYGFKKEENRYLFSKLIVNNSFRVDVIVDEKGIINAKIIDLEFNEEYVNHRIDTLNGDFVNKIRTEYEKILLDIKKNCFHKNYFNGSQANRIADLIFLKYQDHPYFAWGEKEGHGVFRNPINEKWYGLIMNVNGLKIGLSDQIMQIINVKLDEDEVDKLVLKDGFCRAYHMNKKKWITITLDDTLTDQEIMSYIIKSHSFTEKKK